MFLAANPKPPVHHKRPTLQDLLQPIKPAINEQQSLRQHRLSVTNNDRSFSQKGEDSLLASNPSINQSRNSIKRISPLRPSLQSCKNADKKVIPTFTQIIMQSEQQKLNNRQQSNNISLALPKSPVNKTVDFSSSAFEDSGFKLERSPKQQQALAPKTINVDFKLDRVQLINSVFKDSADQLKGSINSITTQQQEDLARELQKLKLRAMQRLAKQTTVGDKIEKAVARMKEDVSVEIDSIAEKIQQRRSPLYKQAKAEIQEYFALVESHKKHLLKVPCSADQRTVETPCFEQRMKIQGEPANIVRQFNLSSNRSNPSPNQKTNTRNELLSPENISPQMEILNSYSRRVQDAMINFTLGDRTASDKIRSKGRLSTNNKSGQSDNKARMSTRRIKDGIVMGSGAASLEQRESIVVKSFDG